MADPSPRVLVLCCDGFWQRYLAYRVAEQCELVGIVTHEYPLSAAARSLGVRLGRYRDPQEAIRYLHYRLRSSLDRRWAAPLIRKLFFVNDRPPEFPSSVPRIHVQNVNARECVEFVRRQAPDLVAVNGTNLLRRPMLDLIPSLPLGIINLHTGLSPYTRGGNCNLFALLEGHPEWVGITIHHIDRGIDSGDLIITRRPELAPDDRFETIEAKVFRLGIDMLMVAIRQLAEGRAARVPQWEKGRLFLKRTGYVYRPYLRTAVNRRIRQGLIRDYLAHREEIDGGVRLVGEGV